MRRPSPPRRPQVLDLVAFVIVLATGVALVALGLSPESLAAVTIALASLYSAWRAGHTPDTPTVEKDARPGEPHAAESGVNEVAEHLGDGSHAKKDLK